MNKFIRSMIIKKCILIFLFMPFYCMAERVAQVVAVSVEGSTVTLLFNNEEPEVFLLPATSRITLPNDELGALLHIDPGNHVGLDVDLEKKVIYSLHILSDRY